VAAEALRLDFERDGFAIDPGALEADELDLLAAAVDRVWRAEAPGGGPVHRLGFVDLDAASARTTTCRSGGR
jgi:hypothetical protein